MVNAKEKNKAGSYGLAVLGLSSPQTSSLRSQDFPQAAVPQKSHRVSPAPMPCMQQASWAGLHVVLVQPNQPTASFPSRSGHSDVIACLEVNPISTMI